MRGLAAGLRGIKPGEHRWLEIGNTDPSVALKHAHSHAVKQRYTVHTRIFLAVRNASAPGPLIRVERIADERNK